MIIRTILLLAVGLAALLQGCGDSRADTTNRVPADPGFTAAAAEPGAPARIRESAASAARSGTLPDCDEMERILDRWVRGMYLSSYSGRSADEGGEQVQCIWSKWDIEGEPSIETLSFGGLTVGIIDTPDQAVVGEAFCGMAHCFEDPRVRAAGGVIYWLNQPDRSIPIAPFTLGMAVGEVSVGVSGHFTPDFQLSDDDLIELLTHLYRSIF